MSRLLLILILLIPILAMVPALSAGQTEPQTFTRVSLEDEVIRFEVPVVLRVKNSDAFKPRELTIDWNFFNPGAAWRPDDAFSRDTGDFWWGLFPLRYRTCFRIDVIVTFERYIEGVDDQPDPFKHVIDFGPTAQTTTQIGSGPNSGLNPIDDKATGTWGWGPIHAEIGVLLGIGRTRAITQETVNALGRIASRYVQLPLCKIKGTQIMEGTSEAPTAKYTSTSSLEIVATVEEDGSLSDTEATYSISHTGWMSNLDNSECEYTSTGEGVGLVVSGSVEGNIVSITVQGEIALHSVYTCAPESDATFPLTEGYGFVAIEGELVDGRFEDEQTFSAEGTTAVWHSVVEVTVVEEEAVA